MSKEKEILKAVKSLSHKEKDLRKVIDVEEIDIFKCLKEKNND